MDRWWMSRVEVTIRRTRLVWRWDSRWALGVLRWWHCRCSWVWWLLWQLLLGVSGCLSIWFSCALLCPSLSEFACGWCRALCWYWWRCSWAFWCLLEFCPSFPRSDCRFSSRPIKSSVLQGSTRALFPAVYRSGDCAFWIPPGISIFYCWGPFEWIPPVYSLSSPTWSNSSPKCTKSKSCTPVPSQKDSFLLSSPPPRLSSIYSCLSSSCQEPTPALFPSPSSPSHSASAPKWPFAGDSAPLLIGSPWSKIVVLPFRVDPTKALSCYWSFPVPEPSEQTLTSTFRTNPIWWFHRRLPLFELRRYLRQDSSTFRGVVCSWL